MVVNSPSAGGGRQPPTAQAGTAGTEASSRLAGDLGRYQDSESLLHGIVRGAVALVPGAQEGSVGLRPARRPDTFLAATGDLSSVVDRLQQDVQEGPLLDAIDQQQTIRVGDLGSEQRWPRFTPRAHGTGVAAILSLPMSAGGDSLGVLNLYSREPDAFTDESVLIGELYAGQSAIALASLSVQAQLRAAVLSRDLIGQAKGILMERYAIAGEEAFSMLTQLSQDANRKVKDIADELVRTRTLVGRRDPVNRRPSPVRSSA